MHLIYKKDYYEDKLKEIDDLFIGYLVPIMDDLNHPLLIYNGKKILMRLLKKIIETKM